MFDASHSAAGPSAHEEFDRGVAKQQATDPAAPINVIVAKGQTTLDPLNLFVAMFYENMDEILEKYPLTKRTLRVMFHLLKRAQFGNLVLYSPAAICKATGIDKAGVSRSLKALRECGILLELAEGGTFLNPLVFTKGRLNKVAENDQLMAAAIADIQLRGLSVSLGTPAQLKAAGIV